MNTIYAGISHRRASETGVIPTIPSGDPLLSTDLFDGEMFINTTDKRAWIRNGSTLNEIAYKDAILHNNLSDLQGGTTNAYYHLDEKNYLQLSDRYSAGKEENIYTSPYSFPIPNYNAIDGIHISNNSLITLNFVLTDGNDKELTAVELRSGESKYIVITEQLTFRYNVLKLVSENVDNKNTYNVTVFFKKYLI